MQQQELVFGTAECEVKLAIVWMEFEQLRIQVVQDNLKKQKMDLKK